MNKYLKEYIHRGLIFAGGGPLVVAIIYLLLEINHVNINLNGYQISLAIVTTLVLAFVHAGSSVFPQIESWSKIKAMFFQGFSIYIVYLGGYLINNWIPFSLLAIGVYTGCFVFGFLLIWGIAYFTTRKLTKKMNDRLSSFIE